MLFLVMLDYLRPLSEVDQHMNAHRAFLLRHYAAGHFLLSGRKEPRTGGVVLAKANTLEEVAQWISDDPFHETGIASYEIIAWEATMAAKGWPEILVDRFPVHPQSVAAGQSVGGDDQWPR